MAVLTCSPQWRLRWKYRLIPLSSQDPFKMELTIYWVSNCGWSCGHSFARDTHSCFSKSSVYDSLAHWQPLTYRAIKTGRSSMSLKIIYVFRISDLNRVFMTSQGEWPVTKWRRLLRGDKIKQVFGTRIRRLLFEHKWSLSWLLWWPGLSHVERNLGHRVRLRDYMQMQAEVFSGRTQSGFCPYWSPSQFLNTHRLQHPVLELWRVTTPMTLKYKYSEKWIQFCGWGKTVFPVCLECTLDYPSDMYVGG